MERLITKKPSNDTVFNNDAVKSQLSAVNLDTMIAIDITRVLIIYTGGTIGMQNNPEHGYLPISGYMTNRLALNARFHDSSDLPDSSEALKNKANVSVPVDSIPDMSTYKNITNGIPFKVVDLPALITPYSLFKKRIRYSILEYDPLLDSSNMTMSDWVKIATDIELNYQLYDAFLVLHGTDTMAYTASALSFLLENLGKSVIITGSQVPLSEVRTDAIDNLLGALTIAGHFTIPEVGLFFDNKLLRGNRASKVNAIEFNAFDSPNLRPLVHVGINIDVSWENIWRPKHLARFRVFKSMNPSVSSLRIFPGITEATVRAFFAPTIKGVILETYGSGNAPSNRPDILEVIKEACDRGVVVVNCSQCKKATVSSLYETGMALERLGVIPGADMTPECALTKLSYLLAKYKNDPVRVRSLIKRNLRGELTIVNRRQRFSHSPFPNEVFQSSNVLLNGIMSVLGITANKLATNFGDSIPNGNAMLEESEAEEHDSKVDLEIQLVPIAFGQACRQADLATLKFFIQEFGAMVNVPSVDGVTPLLAAISAGHDAIVAYLLSNGANVHLRDKFGKSPLLYAITYKNESIIRLLRKTGAHFSESELTDVTFEVCKAVVEGNIQKLKLFIYAGANPNLSSQDGRTPLHLAVAEHKLEIFNFLINLKVNSSLDMKHKTKSMASVQSEDSSDADICDTGCDFVLELEPLDRWGRTPLMDAKQFGFNDMAQILEKLLE
ncbi:asparaginase-domain-containing protein [Globomyces pollinis-pini]|nr:asparaginase-domain-containing protein [Globomyces pollinis-pini]